MEQENNFEIPALIPIEQGEIKSRNIQSNVTLRWIQKGSNFKIFFFCLSFDYPYITLGKIVYFTRDFARINTYIFELIIEIMICFKRSFSSWRFFFTFCTDLFTVECIPPKNFKVDMKKGATNGLGILQILRQQLEGKGGVKNSPKSADII